MSKERSCSARWSQEERTNIVKLFYKNTGRIIDTQRMYRMFYKTKTVFPPIREIKEMVHRFENNGSIHDKKRPGPDFTTPSLRNIRRVNSKVQNRHFYGIFTAWKKSQNSSFLEIKTGNNKISHVLAIQWRVGVNNWLKGSFTMLIYFCVVSREPPCISNNSVYL